MVHGRTKMMAKVLVICLLYFVDALHAQEIVQIPVTTAVAQGPCCAECSGGLKNCIELFLQGFSTEPCTMIICNFSAPEVIDGNSETGLDLNAIIAINGDVVGMSSIDLELGSSLYVLDEVRIERSSNISVLLSLQVSQDGLTFTQVAKSREIDGGEVFNLSSIQGEVSYIAADVRLSLNDNLTNPLPVVMEITVFGVEVGCGVCVDQLLDSLSNLTALINTGFDLLPSSGSVELLRLGIEDVQSTVNHLEGTLLVLEVVLGRREPLEENVTLASTVLRYDLLLTPSIQEKLDNVQALLDNISSMELNTVDLALSLRGVENDVSSELTRTRELNDRVMDFESTLNATFNQITDELALLLAALNETTLIHATITSRNYSAISTQLDSYQNLVNSALSQSQFLLLQVEALNERVTDVVTRLGELENLLTAARNRALESSERAQQALNETQVAEDLVTRINVLLSEVEELNSTIDLSLADIVNILTQGRALVIEATNFSESSEALFPPLLSILSTLQRLLDEYNTSLSAFRPQESCDPSSTPCTSGQLHSINLATNASFIVNSTESVSTLMYAREFLENIDSSGQLFNYTAINQTALRAQDLSQAAISQVAIVDTSSLLSRSTVALSAAQNLSIQSLSLLQRAQDVDSTVVINSNRVPIIQEQLDSLQLQLPPIVNRTSLLLSQTGLRDEALRILHTAQEARNRTIETEQRVFRIEEGLVGVASNLAGTAENVLMGEEALSNAENDFYSISTFLNATRVASEAFVVNVTQFISDNDRIIADIDTLIAGLADIHSRINRINSPIQLESDDEEESYLSLQVPPGRAIDDTIQFETLDMYIWTGPGFRSPALLFYAGPTYFEGEDDISSAETGTEDYFVVTLEDSDVVLRWQMGGSGGVASAPAFRQGHSQIFISRVGSQFQLRVGVSLNGLNDVTTMGNIANNSALFRTSNRTSFFLGGWPEGAQLGVSGSVVSLSSLNPFQGQVQLLLFNGEQWGLWNVRGSSDTMFIGSFLRNELAIQNTWQGPRDTLSSAAAISFDGSGFLWVEQLGNVVNFNTGRRTFNIISRPNSEEDGLVLYAYDPEISLSMEVAYQRGTLRLILRDPNNLDSEPLVDYQQPSTPSIVATSGRDGRLLEILFVENVGFRINNAVNFLSGSASRFFTDLTRVKVWYGGVRQDRIERPFAPEITNSSYYGCIDLFVQDNFDRNILRGSHYTQYYLNSPLQRGFSGTCLQSVYTQDVGLSGAEGGYLSYPYLELVAVTNSPASLSEGISPGVVTISLAFFPEEPNGIVLAARSGDHRVYAVLRDGVIVVGVIDGGGSHVMQAGLELVALTQWNYIIIQLEPGQFSLYIDGISQGPSMSVPGLNFELSTSPTAGPGVLYLGGVDQGFVAEIDDLPPFTGCMSDFAYNFGAISFLNPSMTSSQARYPPGVTYNVCPFLNVSTDPLLAVRPDPTQPVFCLSSPPTELVDTHGGFHTQTTLTTSNVIGLFQNSWELSLVLKQTLDGHVLTILTTQDHVISLIIKNSTPTLSLSGGSSDVGSGGSGGSGGGPIETNGFFTMMEENVFIPISIQCSVMSNTLTCSLLVDTVVVDEPLQAFYNGTIFFPELPITLGKTEDAQGNMVDSFVGCIRSLRINNDPSGFVNVRTDVPCFNNTESGLGFTGISRLGTSLPVFTEDKTSLEITVTFKPLLQNGLLLLVTTADLSASLFTAGMFNGQLRVSNFNLSSPEDFLTFASPSTVCNVTSSSFYTLSLVFTESSITVTTVELGSTGRSEVVLDTPATVLPGTRLSLTVGNTPSGYSVPEGTGQFLFLLSEDVSADSVPPGLVGCVRNVEVDGVRVGVDNADSAELILVDLCAAEDE